MLQTKVGFIVYGVHKDGLADPMGRPFIDEARMTAARQALEGVPGFEVVPHEIAIASRDEARRAFARMKAEAVDAVVLCTGTWVWAAPLVGAIRDFAHTG